MIYVPMLKMRDVEMNVLKLMKKYSLERIIPLVEIISERYQVNYETDENGEYVREMRNTKYYRVKRKPTEQDIITLQHLNCIFESRKMFIDYFRFSLDKYGKNIDFNSVELAYNLSNDFELYKSKVLSVSKYRNLIPVISVKQGFDISIQQLRNLINKLQESSEQIALRITEEWLEIYKEIIGNVLREKDYLLFDIEEQNPETKFMELSELKDLKLVCNIILLNSPRKASISNKEYPEHSKTDLINNCAKEMASTYELEGYGDYCGLKDTLPSKSVPTRGAALALLYDYKENIFYSYCNHDTSLSTEGYKEIIPIIKADEAFLNSNKDCPGFEKIYHLPGTGNWSNWNYINAARYVHQTSKYI